MLYLEQIHFRINCPQSTASPKSLITIICGPSQESWRETNFTVYRYRGFQSWNSHCTRKNWRKRLIWLDPLEDFKTKSKQQAVKPFSMLENPRFSVMDTTWSIRHAETYDPCIKSKYIWEKGRKSFLITLEGDCTVQI